MCIWNNIKYQKRIVRYKYFRKIDLISISAFNLPKRDKTKYVHYIKRRTLPCCFYVHMLRSDFFSFCISTSEFFFFAGSFRSSCAFVRRCCLLIFKSKRSIEKKSKIPKKSLDLNGGFEKIERNWELDSKGFEKK